jgi:hypothetical protein
MVYACIISAVVAEFPCTMLKISQILLCYAELTAMVSVLRRKSGCETLLLNGEGYGGVSNSALKYYKITRPNKISLESFNQVIGVFGSRISCLIAI